MNIKYPLLIDGGLSNELERQGYNINHQLWSALLIDKAPEAIVEAHLAYLKSGARCIITSSYQATLQGFIESGYNRTTAELFIRNTVHLAESAIQHYIHSEKREGKYWIAASIGPYGAYLADGSEYLGKYGISDKTLKDFHLSRMELLDSSGADFFACETIPCLQEAEVLADILGETRKSAWVSFSCSNESHLWDGTPIAEAIQLFSNHPKVFAIGVNCTAPNYISRLIESIRKLSGTKRIVVYPNSGEVYDAESKTWSGLSDPGLFAMKVQEWLNLGADIAGGCCRIGPQHIESVRSLFNHT